MPKIQRAPVNVRVALKFTQALKFTITSFLLGWKLSQEFVRTISDLPEAKIGRKHGCRSHDNFAHHSHAGDRQGLKLGMLPMHARCSRYGWYTGGVGCTACLTLSS
jgi:hypothetical protein